MTQRGFNDCQRYLTNITTAPPRHLYDAVRIIPRCLTDAYPILRRHFIDASMIFRRYVKIRNRYINHVLAIFLRSLNEVCRLLNNTSLLLYRLLSDIVTISWRPIFFFPAYNIVKGAGVVVRYAPNKLGQFYSLLSQTRKELVDECIFHSFFKYSTWGCPEF